MCAWIESHCALTFEVYIVLILTQRNVDIRRRKSLFLTSSTYRLQLNTYTHTHMGARSSLGSLWQEEATPQASGNHKKYVHSLLFFKYVIIASSSSSHAAELLRASHDAKLIDTTLIGFQRIVYLVWRFSELLNDATRQRRKM